MTADPPGDGASRLGMGPSTRDVILTWLPTGIYIILIMVLAFRPPPLLPALRHIDKYVHAAAYAVLALLAYHAFSRSGSSRPFLKTVLLGLAVGMSDEGIQALGRVRTADRYDLLADVAGAAVGAHFARLFPGRVAVGRTGPRS